MNFIASTAEDCCKDQIRKCVSQCSCVKHLININCCWLCLHEVYLQWESGRYDKVGGMTTGTM